MGGLSFFDMNDKNKTDQDNKDKTKEVSTETSAKSKSMTVEIESTASDVRGQTSDTIKEGLSLHDENEVEKTEMDILEEAVREMTKNFDEINFDITFDDPKIKKRIRESRESFGEVQVKALEKRLGGLVDKLRDIYVNNEALLESDTFVCDEHGEVKDDFVAMMSDLSSWIYKAHNVYESKRYIEPEQTYSLHPIK